MGGPPFSLVVSLSNHTQDSDLLLDQLRAIDNNRLVKGPLLRCTEALLAEVDQALREVLDLG